MKVNFLSLLLLLTLISCKKDKKSETKKKPDVNVEQVEKIKNNTRTLKGEFIYSNGAAVLKTRNVIYGIVLDEEGLELKEAVDEVKENEYDMIPVLIQGKIIENPDEGWDQLVEVIKTIKVEEPQPNENIIIESANK
ncbi:hypothetical protein [Psychroflexus maritimus]|uniref:Uncharacterized protein n=1 Tax=Psychroflexus maritimus TaxID=2714865 RepID=A0A967DYP8_9FLAO|nr:hypothetical protein [Psychroflexus maritimus]NGZ90050.1 hypothetical protein [Psychroflexus maritimus]